MGERGCPSNRSHYQWVDPLVLKRALAFLREFLLTPHHEHLPQKRGDNVPKKSARAHRLSNLSDKIKREIRLREIRLRERMNSRSGNAQEEGARTNIRHTEARTH